MSPPGLRTYLIQWEVFLVRPNYNVSAYSWVKVIPKQGLEGRFLFKAWCTLVACNNLWDAHAGKYLTWVAATIAVASSAVEDNSSFNAWQSSLCTNFWHWEVVIVWTCVQLLSSSSTQVELSPSWLHGASELDCGQVNKGNLQHGDHSCLAQNGQCP